MSLAKRSYMKSSLDNEPVDSYSYIVTDATPKASPPAPCHSRGNKPVGTVQSLALYGAGYSTGAHFMPGAIHLNLAAEYLSFVPNVRVSAATLLPEINPFVSELEQVSIEWPDYGLPQVPDNFWPALVQGFLRRTKGRSTPLPVLVACMGGHGRTGTTLAIILGLLGITAPVKMIRKVYCRRAVETEDQVKYVSQIVSKFKQSTAPVAQQGGTSK